MSYTTQKKLSKSKNNIGLFIDLANLWSSYKVVGKTIDFEKLCKYLEKEFNGKLKFRSIYFAYPEVGTRDYDVGGIHKFGVFLREKLKFKITKKPLKIIECRDKEGNLLYDNSGNTIKYEKGNLDVELTMDTMIEWKKLDIIVLFSGDSDFYNLISFLQSKKKKVYVFSTKNNISHELKHHSNKYYDFCNINEIWGNKLRTKSPSKS